MKKLLHLSIVVFTLYITVACVAGLKLDSLCVIEPSSGMCWVNKEKQKGFKISEMENWFGINSEDLQKITDKLNECKKNGGK